jgi:hypothetical protein
MRFRVIDGGLTERRATPDRPLSRSDVQAEAARRIKASGYERCRVRNLVTGEPIPRALQYLKIQITWVADTLAGLDPIPGDYADDKYWPRPN